MLEVEGVVDKNLQCWYSTLNLNSCMITIVLSHILPFHLLCLNQTFRFSFKDCHIKSVPS